MTRKKKVVSLALERAKRSTCDGRDKAQVIVDALREMDNAIKQARIPVLRFSLEIDYLCQTIGRHSFKLHWKNPRLKKKDRK